MGWRIEFSAACERDFELIFDHLFAAYRSFGEEPEDAFAQAERRLGALRLAIGGLARAPHRGTLRPDLGPGLRFVPLAGATVWFEVRTTEERIRILAVFTGGQDHRRHMLRRLLEPER